MEPEPLPDGTWRVVVPRDWPGFAGHFPGDPILPAAVLIDLALAVAGGATGIAKARFLAPVRPGDELRLAVNGARVTIGTTEATVAEIRFLR
jgi:3-hydroxymyristoyl/3-hydroxydecanoyl-(acyl carrier protein) dehydratase